MPSLIKRLCVSNSQLPKLVSECRGKRAAVHRHLWSPPRGPLAALSPGTRGRGQPCCALGLDTLSLVESRVPPGMMRPRGVEAAPSGPGLRVRCSPQVQRPRAHPGPARNLWAPPCREGPRGLWQTSAGPGSLPHLCGRPRWWGAGRLREGSASSWSPPWFPSPAHQQACSLPFPLSPSSFPHARDEGGLPHPLPLPQSTEPCGSSEEEELSPLHLGTVGAKLF